MASVNNVRSGPHYTVGETGPMEELDAKLFIGKALGFSSMEVSLNCLPPGQGSPFVHQHREHEELYLILRGNGEFMIDGTVIPVQPGTALRVEPEARRAWRNNGSTDLEFVVVQANRHSLTGNDGIRLDEDASWPE
jgi:uncharacterized cupin superfamily protein